ncbi:MAG: protein translocase subunit SecF [Ignavibacteriales bacterium]
MRLFSNLTIDYISKRKVGYIISGSLIIISILSFILHGLELGIDFKGGTEIAVKFEKPISISQVRQSLNNTGLGALEIKTFGGETGVLIRTELQNIPAQVAPKFFLKVEESFKKLNDSLSFSVAEKSENSIVYAFGNDSLASLANDKATAEGFQTSLEGNKVSVRVAISDLLKEILEEKIPDNSFKIQKEDLVGPKIGKELKFNAVIAVTLALLVILIYLGFRFKLIFAAGAVIAAFHDVIITLGAFSVLTFLFPTLNLEISISVIAAFLTLVGYSINDTVIVFDRIREYLKIHKTAPIEENINKAINRTMSRTVITSATTLFTVFVLLILGGEVLRAFAFTLFFGIVVGTYSSIFVASAIVYDYSQKYNKKIEF